jgi:Zn finger protein HypA/HybF involved in hydrogenase expression
MIPFREISRRVYYAMYCRRCQEEYFSRMMVLVCRRCLGDEVVIGTRKGLIVLPEKKNVR